MAAHDDSDRLAREAAVLAGVTAREGMTVGGLEFNTRPIDRLDTRLRQAEALLMATYGEPGAGFRMLSDELQERFLWAVADLVTAARGDLACVEAARRSGAA